MKNNIDLEKIKKNMQPGSIIREGFLGNEDRTLEEIITSDENNMLKLGLSPDRISERLLTMIQAGEKGLGEPVTVDDKWTVVINDTRGFVPCPFEDGVFRKRSMVITNLTNGRKIRISELSLHLLKSHHFLQGKGSPYRLTPEDIKDVLGIVS
jgi:hypothetical protein